MTHDLRLTVAMAKAMADADLGDGAWFKMPDAECNVWLAHATAALDAIEAQGWVVVPREPTRDMVHACAKAALVTIALHKLKAIWPWSKRSIVVENINRCWAAMVAARPGAQP